MRLQLLRLVALRVQGSTRGYGHNGAQATDEDVMPPILSFLCEEAARAQKKTYPDDALHDVAEPGESHAELNIRSCADGTNVKTAPEQGSHHQHATAERHGVGASYGFNDALDELTSELVVELLAAVFTWEELHDCVHHQVPVALQSGLRLRVDVLVGAAEALGILYGHLRKLILQFKKFAHDSPHQMDHNWHKHHETYTYHDCRFETLLAQHTVHEQDHQGHVEEEHSQWKQSRLGQRYKEQLVTPVEITPNSHFKHAP
mmetsp:Transcript_65739/g.116705  ORF Transcript_65739/g.116705 Transcript_65739/m.116705 type:complete len:260 (-) Transcript_65739:308-1087(-)